MNVAEIKKTDIANGEGVRVSLFVSGCRRRCKNCFNGVAWDFSYGRPFDETLQTELYEALAPDYIAGLSVLGGEPFEPENQSALVPFLKEVKKHFPHKTIWCYTGYTYDSGAIKEPQANCKSTAELISLIDVLVDGPFVEALKDVRLKFRGSSNQRIIDVQKSLRSGKVVCYLS